MNISTYFYIFFAFSLSALFTFLLIKMPAKFSAIDNPNGRSLHENPTPRTGGVAMLLSVIIASLVFLYNKNLDISLSIIFAGAMVAFVSLVDDFRHVKSIVRFVVHIASAVIIVRAGFVIEYINTPWGDISSWPILASVLTVIFIVWMTNLYNFMDGMDGFAAGMSIFGFATFAVIGNLESHYEFSIICSVLAAAASGFLVWNFPPAKIFMGDLGSASYGYIASVLAIYAHVNNFIPIQISIILFSPFIFDATATLIRRIYNREKFWQAHNSHFYQQLVLSGLGHKKVLMYEYVLMIACSILVIAVYNAQPVYQVFAVLIVLVAYVLIAVIATAKIRNNLVGKSEFNE